MHSQRHKFILFILSIIILSSFGGCGSESSDETYSFTVEVINKTDSPITVRYDWRDTSWGGSDWAQKVGVNVNESKTIRWDSADRWGEEIQVDYWDKSRTYFVDTLFTIEVKTTDFQ